MLFRPAAVLALIASSLRGCNPPQPARDAQNADQTAGLPRRDRVDVGPRVSYVLEDGEESHRRYPDTFEIPPVGARRNLRAGQLVKLMFTISTEGLTQTEWMWVVVERREGDHYLGVLDNDPQCTDEIKHGLDVRFEPRHVIRMYEN